jgi:hypothetical protein
MSVVSLSQKVRSCIQRGQYLFVETVDKQLVSIVETQYVIYMKIVKRMDQRDNLSRDSRLIFSPTTIDRTLALKFVFSLRSDTSSHNLISNLEYIKNGSLSCLMNG